MTQGPHGPFALPDLSIHTVQHVSMQYWVLLQSSPSVILNLPGFRLTDIVPKVRPSFDLITVK